MKYFKIFSILLVSLTVSFSACNSKSSSKKNETFKPVEFPNTPNSNSSTNANVTPSKVVKNTGQIFHYTCFKGCAGGADSAVNCEKCGSLLVHNQAFHSKPNTTQSSSPVMNPPATQTSTNTSGIYHYTCDKGCDGGSSSAGNCSTCGAVLAHNSAFHQ